MKKHHDLKILPEPFRLVLRKIKNFEIRKNDRDYAVGDTITLKEFDGKEFTGNEIKDRTITYIFKGGKYGLSDEYCILQLDNAYIFDGLKIDTNRLMKDASAPLLP